MMTTTTPSLILREQVAKGVFCLRISQMTWIYRPSYASDPRDYQLRPETS